MDFNLKKEIKSTMLNYYKTKSKKNQIQIFQIITIILYM